ncbi:MAG TPA: hypothetical protein VEA69_18225 [Tepidisphaeraceae bacterium]|nr:hypothetical protein [Tepidisphaeraceae bacterium]
MSLNATAQPLADRVPQDAILYVGWCGAKHLPAGYAGSNLEGVLKASELAAVFDQALPRMLAHVGGDAPDDVRSLRAMLAALVGPMWRHPTAVYWGGMDAGGERNRAHPKMAVLVQAGDEAAALGAALRAVVGGAPAEAQMRVEVENGLVVLAAGPADVSAGRKPRAALAARKEFRGVMDRLPKDPAAAVYVDGEGLIEFVNVGFATFEAPAAQEGWARIRDGLGLTGVRRLGWSGGFDARDFVTGAFVEAPAPRAGVAKVLLEAPPLSADILAAIPKGATLAWAGHLDGGLALREFRAAFKRIDDFAAQEMEGRLAAFKEATGVDVQADVLEALGDEWAAYVDPAGGAGGGVTGLVIVNKLRDAARAEKSLLLLQDQVNGLLADQRRGANRPKFAFRAIEQDGLTIHTFSLPGVAPAWAVKNGYLFVAPYPQGVVSAVRHVTAKGESIVGNEAFTALRKQLGQQGETAVWFADLPRLAKGGYADLLMLARAVLGPMDLLGAKSPAMTVPPLEKLLAHLGPAGGACRVDAAGWHMTTRAPFPGSGVVALSGLGSVAASAEAAAAWAALPEIIRAGRRAVDRPVAPVPPPAGVGRDGGL